MPNPKLSSNNEMVAYSAQLLGNSTDSIIEYSMEDANGNQKRVTVVRDGTTGGYIQEIADEPGVE